MLRVFACFISLFLLGCFPYVYHAQNRVLIPAVDLPATLDIARMELEEEGFDATLTIWAIRDQVVNTEHARTISELYFTHIDKIAAQKSRTNADFGVWHFTWAISNFYRNGDASVRRVLDSAYADATRRPKTLKRFASVAEAHVNGPKIVMGDIHGFARAFAHAHVIVPGDKRYLQSLHEYLKTKHNVQDDL